MHSYLGLVRRYSPPGNKRSFSRPLVLGLASLSNDLAVILATAA